MSALTKFSSQFGFIATDKRTLRIQNTGDLFLCDLKDWENARHCPWNLTSDGRLINKAGVYFEEYVGIKTERIVKKVKSLNYCRDQYY